jgi:hypothetical protein
MALLLALLVQSNSVHAQDFFGTASVSRLDSESSVFSGYLTVNVPTDEIVTLELEDSFGNTYTQDVFLFTDGQFLAIVSNGNSPAAAIASGTILRGTASPGIGIILVDTDDLGEDWDPYDVDPNDPTPLPSNCGEVAEQIQDILGGDAQIKTIVSPLSPPENPWQYPLSGTYRGHVTPPWFYHDVVVKDGRVYDGFTGRYGLPIDEYEALWSNPNDLRFPW